MYDDSTSYIRTTEREYVRSCAAIVGSVCEYASTISRYQIASESILQQEKIMPDNF